jgi:hypothetical protein
MVPSPKAVERAWSPPAFHDYGVQRLAGNDLRDLAVLHEPLEALALLAQALGEFKTTNAFEKPGVGFHHIGVHHLPAAPELFQHRRVEPGPPGVNSGGKPRLGPRRC